MFQNKRANSNSKEYDSAKSIGCSLFSFTGVRFFQPKFMSDLNKNGNNKMQDESQNINIFDKKQQKDTKINPFKNQPATQKIKTRSSKQNIDPFTVSKYQQKVEEKKLIKNNNQNSQLKIIKQPYQIVYCKIKGLNNIGNTCYMNSILQCLLNLSKFNSQLLYEAKKEKNGKSRCEVTQQYAQMIQQFSYSTTSTSFVPSKIKSAIAKKKTRFMGNSQQDAQQFLASFLEIVNEELSRVRNSKIQYIELQNDPRKVSIKKLSEQWWEYNKLRDDSIICDNFQGQLISIVTCKKCKNQSVTFDNIWGLPLNLSKTQFSIIQLMKTNWSVQNQISDYYCSVCKKLRDCTKKSQFFRLPQILVIQLKRFDYGKWKKDKIKTAIKLSDMLNIGDFVHSNAPSQSHLYKLSGVVNHFGEIDYGHYTANVYKQSDKKWYLLNDSKASQNTPDSPSNSVYLLFYEKV